MTYYEASAEFSEDGKYRYQLTRIWDAEKPLVLAIGLNPSTADGTTDDPTIRIMVKFLSSMGYGGLKMMNLYAWITPHPWELVSKEICHDPVGLNDQWLETTGYAVQEVIFCWGKFWEARIRQKRVMDMFTDGKCFGYNQDGSPWHPMAMMYKGLKTNDVKLEKYQRSGILEHGNAKTKETQ